MRAADHRRFSSSVPGITTNIGQPIEHRLSHILSGTPAAIAISVYGDDLDVLRAIAKEIEAALKPLPGHARRGRQPRGDDPVAAGRVPPQELAAYGLTPAAAAAAGPQRDLRRRGGRDQRGRAALRAGRAARRVASATACEDLRKLVLRGKGGALVRLDEVADIGPEMASNLIARENAQRKAVVSLNVAEGYNLGHLVGQVRELRRPDRPEARLHREVRRPVRGAAVREPHDHALQRHRRARSCSCCCNLAIGSIRVVAARAGEPAAGADRRHRRDLPDRVAEPAHQLRGAVRRRGTTRRRSSRSPAWSGFITLFGIAVRNGILLVNHYQHLVEEEGRAMHDAIVQGSMERLVPILMTALTAALALIPIILKGDKPGNEILAPLSVVILGGLLTSTFLNLVVVPAGYAAIYRVRRAAASGGSRQ